jgi:hypothetical protein
MLIVCSTPPHSSLFQIRHHSGNSLKVHQFGTVTRLGKIQESDPAGSEATIRQRLDWPKEWSASCIFNVSLSVSSPRL